MSTNGAASTLDSRVADFVTARGLDPSSIEILSGDASIRRYFRARSTDRTMILVLYPDRFDPETFSFTEVRNLLAGWGLPVPKILDQDGQRGIVVLEDLGGLTLQEVLKAANDTKRSSLYHQALRDLVRLQFESVRDPRPLACFQLAFDVEKLTSELDFFVRHFLEAHRGHRIGQEDRTELMLGFHGLCSEIATWPRVLCHRDFHSRNLMFHRNRLYWIDFQDARMGPITYDLASLIRDSYVDLPEELVRGLLDEYRSSVVPGEPTVAFLRRFDLTCVQRNLKSLGTFGFQAAVRGNPIYLPYIPRTLEHVRLNLARYDELSNLRRVLGRHIEEIS